MVLACAYFIWQPNGLPRRLERLGNPAGQTRAQVYAALGEPKSRTVVASGESEQWYENGHTVVLLFDASGTCQGITHQARP